MCGIAGKLNFSSKNPVSLSLLQAMSKALKHRGPDDEGFYVNGNIGMAHSRLKIIDTSDAARQPMVNEDGTCRIVCNGEIYNFRELRKELIKKGHSFVSGSDTEVILHLYEDYGEMCLKHLRGAFAFAIWDEKNKKLFLARDRLGKKPLKYFYNSDFFIFASELKAMLKDGNVPKEPDFDAIHHYLAFQFAPSPLTGFKSIKKLPPACYLVCQEGKVDIVKYWSLSFREKYDLPEKEWQKLIIDKLRESVELRMVSDVPLGAFLSGGIDSSAIVAQRLVVDHHEDVLEEPGQHGGEIGDRCHGWRVVLSAPGAAQHPLELGKRLVKLLLRRVDLARHGCRSDRGLVVRTLLRDVGHPLEDLARGGPDLGLDRGQGLGAQRHVVGSVRAGVETRVHHVLGQASRQHAAQPVAQEGAQPVAGRGLVQIELHPLEAGVGVRHGRTQIEVPPSVQERAQEADGGPSQREGIGGTGGRQPDRKAPD